MPEFRLKAGFLLSAVKMVTGRLAQLNTTHSKWSLIKCSRKCPGRDREGLNIAGKTEALFVVGTSGATNLPMQVGSIAAARGILMVDINLSPNPFTRLALSSHNGFALSGTASEHLSAISDVITAKVS